MSANAAECPPANAPVSVRRRKMHKKKELERIKEESGLSWRKFAESFGIPYRTVQDWHLGNRPMPEYILRLMVYKVETEKLLREYKIEKR